MQQLHWKQPAVLQVNIPHNLSKHGGITPNLSSIIKSYLPKYEILLT